MRRGGKGRGGRGRGRGAKGNIPPPRKKSIGGSIEHTERTLLKRKLRKEGKLDYHTSDEENDDHIVDDEEYPYSDDNEDMQGCKIKAFSLDEEYESMLVQHHIELIQTSDITEQTTTSVIWQIHPIEKQTPENRKCVVPTCTQSIIGIGGRQYLPCLHVLCTECVKLHGEASLCVGCCCGIEGYVHVLDTGAISTDTKNSNLHTGSTPHAEAYLPISEILHGKEKLEFGWKDIKPMKTTPAQPKPVLVVCRVGSDLLQYLNLVKVDLNPQITTRQQMEVTQPNSWIECEVYMVDRTVAYIPTEEVKTVRNKTGAVLRNKEENMEQLYVAFGTLPALYPNVYEYKIMK